MTSPLNGIEAPPALNHLPDVRSTQILRNVLRKDRMPEYEKWVVQIREMTTNLPGFQDVVKFPMHGDINSLPPDGQLVFIVILTFDCYESLEKATANPERFPPRTLFT